MLFLRRLALNMRMAAVCAVTGIAVLSGCASTGAPGDPLESLNRGIYTFNDGLDTVLVKPAAEIYQGVVPPVARTGVSNVFSNLNDVIVALNNLLQGKFAAGISDIGRVLLNTTAGLFGLFDIATVAGLEKHDEDFGQTLGYWGIGNGPYLVLPLLGPSTLRDTVGRVADYKTDPVTYIDPTSDRNAAQGLRVVSRRAELLNASRLLDVAAIDEYAFVRDAYLQRRRNLIYDGNPPRERFDANHAPQDEGRTAARGVNLRTDTPPTVSGPTLLWSGTMPTPAEEELRLRKAPDPVAALTGTDHATAPATAGPPVVRVWLSRPR